MRRPLQHRSNVPISGSSIHWIGNINAHSIDVSDEEVESNVFLFNRDLAFSLIFWFVSRAYHVWWQDLFPRIQSLPAIFF